MHRWRFPITAALVVAAAYALLVVPGFTPYSSYYNTSLHGLHESRFLSGWNITQHRWSPVNIVARVGAPRAIFEFPPFPMPASSTTLIKLNLLPREPCQYAILLNDQPIGIVTSTVRGRGEKFFFRVPPNILRADKPNLMTVVNQTPETSTEWESVELRNYYGTLREPDGYFLVGVSGTRAAWSQRLAPGRLFLPALGGLLLGCFLAWLRRRDTVPFIHILLRCANVVVWGTLIGTASAAAWLGFPLAITPRAFWQLVWGPAVIIILIWALVRTGAVTAITLSQTVPILLLKWRAWLQRTLPGNTARLVDHISSDIVLFVAGLWVLCTYTAKTTWQWLIRDFVLHAFIAFAALMLAGAACKYLQWLVLAEWLGDGAFPCLLLSLGVAARPQIANRPQPTRRHRRTSPRTTVLTTLLRLGGAPRR